MEQIMISIHIENIKENFMINKYINNIDENSNYFIVTNNGENW